ncbi:MAG TPA: type III pantothenate kinase [Bacteroidia bacterium]|jgi:type III pantothenate kinase|nr:type III pantothenate kinase [Bacteroidia bacterium]
MPLHLILDLGNSRTKAFLFEKQSIIDAAILENCSNSSIHSFLRNRTPSAAIIGSSINIPAEVASLLAELCPNIILDQHTRLPVTNQYSTKDSLGYDRIAAAIGARQLFPNEPVLAIVAGTCITYNIIAGNSFLGGAISPGLQMRAKAMHEFTEKLPIVEVKQASYLGTTTETNLQSGIFNGAVEEIKGMKAAYEKKHPGLKTVLGGGDTELLGLALKNGIFARPELVAEGLNGILQFNVENNLL